MEPDQRNVSRWKPVYVCAVWRREGSQVAAAAFVTSSLPCVPPPVSRLAFPCKQASYTLFPLTQEVQVGRPLLLLRSAFCVWLRIARGGAHSRTGGPPPALLQT